MDQDESDQPNHALDANRMAHYPASNRSSVSMEATPEDYEGPDEMPGENRGDDPPDDEAAELSESQKLLKSMVDEIFKEFPQSDIDAVVENPANFSLESSEVQTVAKWMASKSGNEMLRYAVRCECAKWGQSDLTDEEMQKLRCGVPDQNFHIMEALKVWKGGSVKSLLKKTIRLMFPYAAPTLMKSRKFKRLAKSLAAKIHEEYGVEAVALACKPGHDLSKDEILQIRSWLSLDCFDVLISAAYAELTATAGVFPLAEIPRIVVSRLACHKTTCMTLAKRAAGITRNGNHRLYRPENNKGVGKEERLKNYLNFLLQGIKNTVKGQLKRQLKEKYGAGVFDENVIGAEEKDSRRIQLESLLEAIQAKPDRLTNLEVRLLVQLLETQDLFQSLDNCAGINGRTTGQCGRCVLKYLILYPSAEKIAKEAYSNLAKLIGSRNGAATLLQLHPDSALVTLPVADGEGRSFMSPVEIDGCRKKIGMIVAKDIDNLEKRELQFQDALRIPLSASVDQFLKSEYSDKAFRIAITNILVNSFAVKIAGLETDSFKNTMPVDRIRMGGIAAALFLSQITSGMAKNLAKQSEAEAEKMVRDAKTNHYIITMHSPVNVSVSALARSYNRFRRNYGREFLIGAIKIALANLDRK